ncbi:MAG: CDP-alcohol phosphatidyltransferase family protein [Acidobacteriota bacterium]|nr:CDP-alcohol phosphatidyltransferase family protein [Acidobacteriota bacterium]
MAEPSLEDAERTHREGPPGRARLRRLLGFDRSIEPAHQTARDRPWRPFTIPNAVTFMRLAALPAFLAVALTEDRGQGALSIALFAVIGWGDVADGALARLTGQYSRLGALLDPATDRLLAVSGAIVCWRWELLPRWALAVLMAREVGMLALGRYAIARRVELRITRLGRAAIIPVRGSLFFAMLALRSAAEVLLYLGIALAFAASARYVQVGLRSLRAGPGPPAGTPADATRAR